ncbi:hypothetical protein [Bradyrhizobium jicamae]|uniref:hypothetical protein n=1 Tax=Bradyrhizobium jicamae TaxID=280332 RepID=UPI00390811A7
MTPPAAQTLVADLGLREATGRGAVSRLGNSLNPSAVARAPGVAVVTDRICSGKRFHAHSCREIAL